MPVAPEANPGANTTVIAVSLVIFAASTPSADRRNETARSAFAGAIWKQLLLSYATVALVSTFSVDGCLHRLRDEPVAIGPQGLKEAMMVVGVVRFETFDRLFSDFDLCFQPLLPYFVHRTLISARRLTKRKVTRVLGNTPDCGQETSATTSPSSARLQRCVVPGRATGCERDRCYFLRPFNQARNFSMKLDMARTYAPDSGEASARDDEASFVFAALG
jgi:hypothetical protein